MIKFLVYFLNSFIISIALFYTNAKIADKCIDYKKIKTWFVIIIYSLTLVFTYMITYNFAKVVINYILMIVASKYILKSDNIVKLMIETFISFLLLIFSEIMASTLIISILNIKIANLKSDYFSSIIGNFSVSLTLIILVSIKPLNKFLKKTMNSLQVKSGKSTAFIIVISVLISSILLYYVYYEVNPIIGFVICILLISMYSFLTLAVIKERSDNIKLQIESEVLTNNLNEYEKVLDQQLANNHENKNQLIAIKGMLNGDSKNVNSYIDDILKIKEDPDKNLLIKTQKLPSGGLQGLVYQKLLYAKSKQILFNLNISKAINKKVLKNIDILTNQQICTIVGIYLDNAIEAAEKSKDKAISVHFYADESNFTISISNNFCGPIEFDKIDEKGYSTKGVNRGYGLNIVKKILDGNKNILSQREIIGNLFRQILKIKI